MATLHGFDSVRQAIGELTETLGVSRTYLAASLGVSERTLGYWCDKGPGDLNGKSRRLKRLYEVVQRIQQLRPSFAGKDLLAVLENGDVPIQQGSWDDIDTLPLIEYICAYPDEGEWLANVAQALTDFDNTTVQPGERPKVQHKDLPR